MKPKLKMFISILVAFFLGGIGGGYVGKTYFSERGGRGGQSSREQVSKEFSSKLRLDATQSGQVDSLLESFRAGFNETKKQYTEAFKSRRDTLRKEIRKLLTSDQNLLFDDYIRELDEREKKYRKGQR